MKFAFVFSVVAFEDLRFENWVIPGGPPVSITSALLHHDESIFPKSREFQQERWIEDPRLDRYLVSFVEGQQTMSRDEFGVCGDVFVVV
jgi:cytochrome P450